MLVFTPAVLDALGEDEEHGVRLRQQRERELGLGADRVESGRVEDDEALLQQRMREVDDRVPPARDVEHAFIFGRQRLHDVVRPLRGSSRRRPARRRR